MKKKINLFLPGVMAMFLLGCGMKESDPTSVSEGDQIVEAFDQGNMESIHAIVFGPSSLPIDDDLEESVENQEHTGILERIFEADTIQIKQTDVENKKIVYQVTAPDMSAIFEFGSENLRAMDEDAFEQYLDEYMKNADSVTTTVSVPYTDESGTIEADYKNPEFINAITGGFLDAYRDLYQKAIAEYLEKLEETE